MKSKKIIYTNRKATKDPAKKLEIRPVDKKLIQLMRSIDNGVIEKIIVRNGSPVSFKFAWKSKKGR